MSPSAGGALKAVGTAGAAPLWPHLRVTPGDWLGQSALLSLRHLMRRAERAHATQAQRLPLWRHLNSLSHNFLFRHGRSSKA